MVTWIVWARPQPPPAPSRQSANVVVCAVSASTRPPGPRISAAADAGSRGSARHGDPGPARVSPWPPGSRTATAVPGPNDIDRRPPAPMRSGADRAHPLGCDQAVTRLALAPDPACSSATTPLPAALSPSTSMSWPASDRGTAGPAACQLPPRSVKTPAVPGRLQLPASIGSVAGPKAAAVKPVSPQACPAAVRVTARTLASRVHLVPLLVPSSAAPPLVSAMRRPPGPEASAAGA